MNDISNFMQAYEQANNSHVFANVQPFIAANATYWFTDGSYNGINEIKDAIQATFDTIQNETYKIENLRWVVQEPTVAVCTYTFTWQGIVNGNHTSGNGRGTNVLQHRDGVWQITHEHLSN